MELKVFISGGMSGYADWNFPAFNHAEEKLTELGYQVVNPAKLFDNYSEVPSWEECMSITGKELDTCNAIFMLDGWEQSKGATIEREKAIANGYVIFENGIKKLYANKEHYTTSDENLLNDYDILTQFSELKESSLYRKFQKIVHDRLREAIGTKNLLGLVKSKDNGQLVILVYNIEATQDNFYPQLLDKNNKMVYLLIED